MHEYSIKITINYSDNGSDYKLTTQDLDDIETAYEFQTSDLN